ncbi:MAG: hypothetical protein ABW190_06395 [Rhizobacter sp.]
MNAITILMIVAGVLLLLVLKDLFRERRFTTAAKIRLFVVLVLMVASAWTGLQT